MGDSVFVYKYFKKTFFRYISVFILIFVILDLVTLSYYQSSNILFRHFFISNDLLCTAANILFWVFLYIPIAIDLSEELSTFGISVFSRVSKFKYVLIKSFTNYLYCLAYLALSFLLSFLIDLIQKNTSYFFLESTKIIFILSVIGFVFIQVINIISWKVNSSYIVSIIYILFLTISQTPVVQKKLSVMQLYYSITPTKTLIMLVICVFLSVLWWIIIYKKDFVGIKKGTYI